MRLSKDHDVLAVLLGACQVHQHCHPLQSSGYGDDSLCYFKARTHGLSRSAEWRLAIQGVNGYTLF
jgi:hypothetical protein